MFEQSLTLHPTSIVSFRWIIYKLQCALSLFTKQSCTLTITRYQTELDTSSAATTITIKLHLLPSTPQNTIKKHFIKLHPLTILN